MADIAINKSNAKRYLNGSIPPSSPNTIDGEPVPPSSIVGGGEWVPYLGAKDNVDLGVHYLKASHLKLKTDLATIPTDQGSMYWDEDEETIAVILNGSTTKVGEDIFFQVKNQSGATIPKGTAVRFDGVVGASGRIKIVPFQANGSNPSIYFLGVTYEAIANGADGKALFNGKIRGVNTSAFSVGDILYASPTVAGGFTTTKPIAPNNIISVAAVLSSGANGILLIRPQIGSNINNDEGVKITTPTTGDILQLQASGLWENKPLADLGYLPLTGGTVTGTLIVDGSGNTTPRIVSIFNGGINRLLTPVLRLYGSSDISSRYIELFGDSATANRRIEFPDADGTVALTSDIPWLNNANGIHYNGGNVGIGTSSPQAKLHISNSLGGAIPSNYFTIEGSIANNLNYPGISFKGGTLATTYPSIRLENGGLALALNSGIASAFNNPAQLFLNNGVITFSTANNASLSERMRITSDGKLLLNTTVNAGFQLDVNGNARISGSGNAVTIFSNNNSLALGLGYQGALHGYIGGISSRLEAYSVNGGYVFLNASSVWVPASDKNRKRNFENYNLGLGAILGLQPKLYNMDFQKDGDVKQVGLVAQEVREFIPDAYEENQKFIGLNYNAIIVTLINAIKELKSEIDIIRNN